MINKIIDEIHSEKYTMKHIEAVMAIDFETIVIIGSSDISWTIEDIIKEHRYHIYKTRKFTIIDDEVYRNRDIDRKQYEFWQEFGDGIGYQKFIEWIYLSKKVMEIKIEPDEFYLKQLHKKYQEANSRDKYLKVKDLIKRLQKSDQEAYVVIEDQEYGGYHSLYKSDKPMDITTIRDCPDCNRGCCHKCPGREIFNKKLLSF